MLDSYLELFRLYYTYPDECWNVVLFIAMQQFLFLWTNYIMFSMMLLLAVLLIDVNWQIFLSLYITQKMDYVWRKSIVENGA